jgi:OmpA-OmpF porin, OOP family
MSKIRKIAAVLLVPGALMTAPQAFAQFYFGGSAGKSDYESGNVVPDLITSVASFDGKDSGYKIFAGYQFNPNFGMEITYVDLGKAQYSGTFGPLPVTGGSLETTGANFSAVGTIPLNPSFSLFGKLGFFVWEQKARDITDEMPFSGKDDGQDLSLGVGASLNLTRNVSLRLEWERFEAFDSIDFLSLGVAFRF